MATHPKPQSSFSPGRKWKIGFDLFARTVLVLAVVVMANYISAQFPHRFYFSSQTRVKLSSRTVSVLQALTNRVTVTLYYDRKDDFYPDIVALLNEYRAVNPKISFTTVDYVRDAGEAEKLKEHYGLASSTDKNLVIFDSNDHVKMASGDALIKYAATGMSKDKKLEIGPVAFNAEQMFTSILLALQDAKPFTAYFLQGHYEPSLTDSGQSGYLKFASILQGNYIDVQPISLLGDSKVPPDCDLLIIAGPRGKFSPLELQKISDYISQGGRLFVLLDSSSVEHPTGLEDILLHWGVSVAADYVRDIKNTTSSSGADVVVQQFSQHPIVNPLMRSELQMLYPRPVSAVNSKNPSPDAPEVTELTFSGDASTLVGDSTAAPRRYPLMVAVEQKNVVGVANSRGTMRMVVAGDSIFLNNQVIEGGTGGANRDFLGNAVNWLLDRPTLLQGIGPQPVTEFRLTLTATQQREVNWLLLAALPGAVLLFGGLVWLVRRK